MKSENKEFWKKKGYGTPAKKIDIFAKIEEVYSKLKEFLHNYKKDHVEFTKIVPSKEKKDKIWTFISLLHLANKDKIDLKQETAFGKIFIIPKEI